VDVEERPPDPVLQAVYKQITNVHLERLQEFFSMCALADPL